MLNRHYFLRWSDTFGPFDWDGAASNDGSNAQVANGAFNCPDRSFLRQDLKNVKNLYLNAPFNLLKDFLEHYLRQKIKYPQLRGAFLVPKRPRAPWYCLMRNFTLKETIPAGSDVFTAPDGDGGRNDIGPTPFDVELYIDTSDCLSFLPARLRPSAAPYWTHSKVLVTDGKRVLLTRETADTPTVYFPGGKRDPSDDTPVATALRELHEETGLCLRQEQLQDLGTHTSGSRKGNKCYDYLATVDPDVSYDNSKAIWVRWDDLLVARSTGGALHPTSCPLRFTEFGPSIDKYINRHCRADGAATVAVSTTAAGTTLLSVEGRLDGRHCRVLLDSGASQNFVSKAWLRRQDNLESYRGRRFKIRMADGTSAYSSSHLHATFTADDYNTTIDALVTDIDNWDVILGAPWLRAANPDIRWSTNEVLSRATGQPLYRCTETWTKPVAVYLASAKEVARSIRKRTRAVFLCTLQEVETQIQTLTSDVGPDFDRQLRTLLQPYADVIEEPTDLPPSRPWDFPIDLESDVPPKQVTYRMSPAELAEVKRQLQELLEKGWIRPSTSPYGAPILFVRKKDNSLRMCVDYRRLNEITTKNRTPLPRIDELLDSLHGATVFSSLDLYKGYHQCRVKEADIHKTAFRTHYGLYEFCVLPFGLTNAPACFQTMMNQVLGDYLGKFCVVYLDDILIYSKTDEEHLQHLRLIFGALQRHQLHVRLDKCFFGRRSVDYLGFVVQGGKISMDSKKVQAVQQWPTPTCVRDVRGFLGLAGFYRRFVHRFSAIAAPLTDLTKTSVPFKWSSTAQQSFDAVKRALTEAPVLITADSSPEASFTIYSDASGFAVGSVLLQDQGNGLQPVAYHARKMNQAERNYPVHEQELLGVKDALLAFRCYIDGCAKITMITDHDTLRYFFQQRDLSTRQVRWLMLMAPYQRQLDIVYRKGALNHADSLSRRPDLWEPLQKFCHVPDLLSAEDNEESLFTTTTTVRPDTEFFDEIRAGYASDNYYTDTGTLPSW